jgi:hypothetical protein
MNLKSSEYFLANMYWGPNMKDIFEDGMHGKDLLFSLINPLQKE